MLLIKSKYFIYYKNTREKITDDENNCIFVEY